LVIAGAGSGKTHTLTWRVAHLLDRGVPADRILLMTFTNKAAQAMTERVCSLLGADMRALSSGTFHSIGNRILRAEAPLFNYPRDYTILDGSDAATLMSSCLAEVTGLTSATALKRFPKGSVLLHLHSMAQNTCQTLAHVIRTQSSYFMSVLGELEATCARYQARKKEMAVVDFDDLLVLWHTLLTEHPDAAKRWTSRFDHILIDEYQDTNHLQGAIVDLMAEPHGNLMVVGDDCQSIYAFRGADYTNILEFPKRYPDSNQLRLEINYRSTPQILNLANSSIHKNKKQFDKSLMPERPSGPQPALIGLRDATQQAEFVCQRVLELVEEGVPMSEIAVLYRSHHHSMELQVELTRRAIPYVVRSGTRFFEQAHIKDVLAYLRFLYNCRDELSFTRFAQLWPDIGARTAQQLWASLSAHPDPLDAVLNRRVKQPAARARASWTKLTALLADLQAAREAQASPADLLRAILTSHYQHYAITAFEDADRRIDDLQQLANYAGQYEELELFLGELALMTTVSAQELGREEQEQDAICLTSIHQAKGLEWSACFILWLADGHFPSFHATKDAELEEERRLFYVAATRARDDLYLCHPFSHHSRDGSFILLRPSTFITELEAPRAPEREPWERWVIE
jgi:DNA helicase-2/ATP-dependent DNA helicase PcrA